MQITNQDWHSMKALGQNSGGSMQSDSSIIYSSGNNYSSNGSYTTFKLYIDLALCVYSSDGI